MEESQMITYQPISIALLEDEWPERIELSKKYFESIGLNTIYWVTGIHAEKFGVTAARPYLRDNPEQNYHLPQKTVGNYLTAYMVFSIAQSHPEWEYILYIEDDTRFHADWKERMYKALNDVPVDFDWLFLSHCCTEGRETKHIHNEIFEVKYPQAGHVSLIARKALPVLIEHCRDACNPMDVDLFDNVFKELKVYTLLPRLAEQVNTNLPQ